MFSILLLLDIWHNLTVNSGLTWGGCKHTCIGPTLIAIPIPIPAQPTGTSSRIVAYLG